MSSSTRLASASMVGIVLSISAMAATVSPDWTWPPFLLRQVAQVDSADSAQTAMTSCLARIASCYRDREIALLMLLSRDSPKAGEEAARRIIERAEVDELLASTAMQVLAMAGDGKPLIAQFSGQPTAEDAWALAKGGDYSHVSVILRELRAANSPWFCESARTLSEIFAGLNAATELSAQQAIARRVLDSDNDVAYCAAEGIEHQWAQLRPEVHVQLHAALAKLLRSRKAWQIKLGAELARLWIPRWPRDVILAADLMAAAANPDDDGRLWGPTNRAVTGVGLAAAPIPAANEQLEGEMFVVVTSGSDAETIVDFLLRAPYSARWMGEASDLTEWEMLNVIDAMRASPSRTSDARRKSVYMTNLSVYRASLAAQIGMLPVLRRVAPSLAVKAERRIFEKSLSLQRTSILVRNSTISEPSLRATAWRHALQSEVPWLRFAALENAAAMCKRNPVRGTPQLADSEKLRAAIEIQEGVLSDCLGNLIEIPNR